MLRGNYLTADYWTGHWIKKIAYFTALTELLPRFNLGTHHLAVDSTSTGCLTFGVHLLELVVERAEVSG